MEQEFLTGKCPKCMQELRVPASLAEFSCMYCGARLAQSDLVTEAAETPAAPDADAYAAALEELSGCIRNYRGFHKRVTKTDYVPAFDEYEAGCRAVVEFFYIVLAEVCGHVIPYMKTVCESYALRDQLRQWPVLLGGAAVFALLTMAAERSSVRRFEQVDL